MTTTLSCNVRTYVIILGCPTDGPAALDFRRDHDLPDDRADNHFPIEGSIDSEASIRALIDAGYRYITHSDGRCIIDATDRCGSGFPGVAVWSGGDRTQHGATYGWRAEVAPNILRRGDLCEILLAISDDSPEERAARRQRDVRIGEIRQKIEEHEESVRALWSEMDALQGVTP